MNVFVMLSVILRFGCPLWLSLSVFVLFLVVVLSLALRRIRGCKMPVVHRAIGRKHFFCTESFLDNSWLIYETRCKSKGVDGGFVYQAFSRYYAYKIARVLNELYRLNRLGALARWRFVCSSSLCTREQTIYDLYFAQDLLSPDDSKFLSASIVGGQDA